MLGAEGFLADREGLLGEGDCLGVATLTVELQDLSIQGLRLRGILLLRETLLREREEECQAEPEALNRLCQHHSPPFREDVAEISQELRHDPAVGVQCCLLR